MNEMTFFTFYRETDGSYNTSFDNSSDERAVSIVELAKRGIRAILERVICEENVGILCNLRAKANITGIYNPREFQEYFIT